MGRYLETLVSINYWAENASFLLTVPEFKLMNKDLHLLSGHENRTARILICSTCQGERKRKAEVDTVTDALCRAGLADQVSVECAGCIGSCEAPVSIGLQGDGRASYVFSGINLLDDADDIAATCRAYLNTRKGWIIDAHVCGRLRECLQTRLPALR